MKRRKFIQVALVAAPALATSATAGTRLFGTPGSVEPTANAVAALGDKLVLPLARSGVPPQFWARLQSASTMVIGVLNSPDEGKAFAASPARYFAKHGLDHSDATLEDETVRLLLAVSEPTVKDAISRKDYTAFMHYLKATGVLSFDSSTLQKELEVALSRNADEIRSILSANLGRLPEKEREAFLTMLAASGSGATEDDLAITYELMASELENSPSLAIVVATIALVVVTVAAAVVLWVYAAGWVWGMPTSLPGTAFGKLAEADPNLVKNYERAMQIAALTGERAILQQGTRDVILAESVAVINAMRNTKVLDVSAEGGSRLAEAMSLYAYKAMGI